MELDRNYLFLLVICENGGRRLCTYIYVEGNTHCVACDCTGLAGNCLHFNGRNCLESETVGS